MSGRKQHFIPQSLLRGFGRPGKGDKIQVVVYTYERGIFTAATDGIGAERNFYSELSVAGGDETLDDKITNYESPMSEVIASLRQMLSGEAVESLAAAELVTHLIIRNDHFRKSMSSAGSALFGTLVGTLTEEDQARAMLGVTGDKPSAMFNDVLQEELAKVGPLLELMGMSREAFGELAYAHVQANFGAFHSEIKGPLMEAFTGKEEQLAEVAASAQRKNLEKAGMSPLLRVEQLSAFRWRVAESNMTLVLPDCVAVARDGNEAMLPLMLADAGEASAVFMPVSANRVLVGSREDEQPLPDDLNEAFASCSWDFFVAPERTPELEALRAKLRSASAQFVDETVSGAMSEVLAKNAGDEHQG